MKYKIEVRNFQSKSISVRVSKSTMFDGTFIEIDKKVADEIDDWVVSSKLGRRIAWDMWQLKNKQAVTLFMMKWS
jgi:hypothetical protein